MDNKIENRILRIKDLEIKIGLKRSTIYELMESGDFPGSVPLGARAVGWLEPEVDGWITSRRDKRDAAANNTRY